MQQMRQWQKEALREIQETARWKLKMRLHIVIAVAFIALLVAGPLALENDRNTVPLSAEEQRAAVTVETHRKAVFDERRNT